MAPLEDEVPPGSSSTEGLQPHSEEEDEHSDDSREGIDELESLDSMLHMSGIWFMNTHGHIYQERDGRCRLQDFPPLPDTVPPLEGELASICDVATSDSGIKKEVASMRLGSSKISKSLGPTTEGSSKKSEDASKNNSAPPGKRGIASHVTDYLRKKLCCKGQTLKQNHKRSAEIARKWGNTHNLLHARELGLCGGGGFSPAQMCHMVCDRYLPNKPVQRIDAMSSRAYTGQFSHDGKLFIAAYQDKRIRVYDVERNWSLSKDVIARMLRWTISDTALSPDGRFLLYSSMTPIVHMVNIGSNPDEIVSLANVSDVHDALYFGCWEDDIRYAPSFGIMSITWSSDSREIVAGTSDRMNVNLFDVEARKTTVAVQGHSDDVNAVAFLDDSPQIFASGSDDTLVKIWDRRTMSRAGSPAGILAGHIEGITHIDTKGDGRYLISNSKDQTIKLWDIRKMKSEDDSCKQAQPCLPHFNWDYRWNSYPGTGKDIRHPYDTSLMTYRGHSVLQTLIRSYFSPMHTTGQRYIYTGSHSGKIHMYDLVTAEEVQVLDFHQSIVRDCSWHPYNSTLVSVSWDGTIVRWDPSVINDGSTLRPAMFGDRFTF